VVHFKRFLIHRFSRQVRDSKALAAPEPNPNTFMRFLVWLLMNLRRWISEWSPGRLSKITRRSEFVVAPEDPGAASFPIEI
jgi:hypothetical protein